MTHTRYDKTVYINLTQDQPTALVDSLAIHSRVVELFKIPIKQDLTTINKIMPLPNNLTHQSKIIFAAHGHQELSDCVFDRNNEEAVCYSLEDVAEFFGKILSHPQFKNPNIQPRLKLVMAVCEGIDFAKNLQKKLHEDYGIYVDMVANKHIIIEEYEFEPTLKHLNIPSRLIKAGKEGERTHQLPHSKVLLQIREDGSQIQFDAYELKWIEDVLVAFYKNFEAFKKWADTTKPTNQLIMSDMKFLCETITKCIMDNLQEVSLTANLLLQFLTSLHCSQHHTQSHPALNYELFNLDIKRLIDRGNQVINLNITSYFLRYALQQVKKVENEPFDIELMINSLKAQKAKFSALLEEYAETKSEDTLAQLETMAANSNRKSSNK